MHLSVREGGHHLHSALLDFYTRSFGLDRVILRDEGNLLPKPVVADCLAGPKSINLKEVLLVRADGVIEEFVAE